MRSSRCSAANVTSFARLSRVRLLHNRFPHEWRSPSHSAWSLGRWHAIQRFCAQGCWHCIPDENWGSCVEAKSANRKRNEYELSSLWVWINAAKTLYWLEALRITFSVLALNKQRIFKFDCSGGKERKEFILESLRIPRATHLTKCRWTLAPVFCLLEIFLVHM